MSNELEKDSVIEEEVKIRTNEVKHEETFVEKNEMKTTEPRTKEVPLKSKNNDGGFFGGFVTLGIVSLMLFLFFGYLTHGVSTQIQDNTIILQTSLDDVVHHIDLFEVSKNENFLILLQSDLNKMDVLLEQTKAMDDSYLSFSQKSEVSKLHQLIKTNIFYLEECLKQNMQFVPNDLYQFRTELSFVEKELSGNPVINYTDLIQHTNELHTKFRRSW